MNNIFAVIKIKKKLAIIIEVQEIFLNFSGLDRYDGKKYKYDNPVNANKFVNPVLKVVSMPFPSKGYIFLRLKFLLFPMNARIITSAKTGNTISVLLNILLLFNLTIIAAAIIKRNTIKIRSVIG